MPKKNFRITCQVCSLENWHPKPEGDFKLEKKIKFQYFFKRFILLWCQHTLNSKNRGACKIQWLSCRFGARLISFIINTQIKLNEMWKSVNIVNYQIKTNVLARIEDVAQSRAVTNCQLKEAPITNASQISFIHRQSPMFSLVTKNIF